MDKQCQVFRLKKINIACNKLKLKTENVFEVSEWKDRKFC
jgi:hypothetical protein